jgi:hypothetical protein
MIREVLLPWSPAVHPWQDELSSESICHICKMSTATLPALVMKGWKLNICIMHEQR